MLWNVKLVTPTFLLTMANMAINLNAESCNNSSAHYDSPDHSILSDIGPELNYLNSIKEFNKF